MSTALCNLKSCRACHGPSHAPVPSLARLWQVVSGPMAGTCQAERADRPPCAFATPKYKKEDDIFGITKIRFTSIYIKVRIQTVI